MFIFESLISMSIPFRCTRFVQKN